MSRYGYVPPPPSMWGGVVVLIFLANVIFSIVQSCSQGDLPMERRALSETGEVGRVR